MKIPGVARFSFLALLAAGGCEGSTVRAVGGGVGGSAGGVAGGPASVDGSPVLGEQFGAAVVLAMGSDPVGIAIDATSVYFSNYIDAGGVVKVAKTGGPVQVLAPGSVYGIAVDDTSVYFTDPDAGVLWRVDKGGGTPVMVAGGLQGPTALAVDATDVYVAGGPSPIFKVSKTGQVTTLVTTGVSALALAASDVYFTTYDAKGTAARVPKTGGTPTVIAPDQAYPWSIAISSGRVYWANEGQPLDMLVGSSRVDLQACKLEYSIVSPK